MVRLRRTLRLGPDVLSGPAEGTHGNAAGPAVRSAGEDRGAAAARRPDRRAGAGAGPEGRADPEAAERAGQVPLGDPARHGPAGPGPAEEPGAAAGPAPQQEAGHLRRTHGLRHQRAVPRHAAVLPQEPTVGPSLPPAGSDAGGGTSCFHVGCSRGLESSD